MKKREISNFVYNGARAKVNEIDDFVKLVLSYKKILKKDIEAEAREFIEQKLSDLESFYNETYPIYIKKWKRNGNDKEDYPCLRASLKMIERLSEIRGLST